MGSGPERRVLAAEVAVIAGNDVALYFGERDIDFTPDVSGGHLQPAAPGARLHAGGDKQLHIGIWRNHRADVTPVEHRAGRLHGRPEEHTSELQSLMRSSYAVFCLKQKNKRNRTQA